MVRDFDSQDLQDKQDYRSNSRNDFLTNLVNPVNPVPFFLNRQQEIAAELFSSIQPRARARETSFIS